MVAFGGGRGSRGTRHGVIVGLSHKIKEPFCSKRSDWALQLPFWKIWVYRGHKDLVRLHHELVTTSECRWVLRNDMTMCHGRTILLWCIRPRLSAHCLLNPDNNPPNDMDCHLTPPKGVGVWEGRSSPLPSGGLIISRLTTGRPPPSQNSEALVFTSQREWKRLP